MEISVCDTGPGVVPAVTPRLFESFCTSKPNGTGLGLAISRTIVERSRRRPGIPAASARGNLLRPSPAAERRNHETANTNRLHS